MKKENALTTIKILTLLQLGDKMDITILNSKTRLWVSILVRTIVIVAITALVYVLMSLVWNMMQIPITGHLLTFILILMQVMGIVTCTFGLLKTLYQSKDNALLLSYPAKHNEVFFSKLIVYYIAEFLRGLTFLLPFILAFGIYNSGTHWTYYLNTVLFTFLLPLFCVLISALLSLPVMFISDFLKGHTIVTSVLLLTLLAGVFFVIITFLSSLPQNLILIAYYKRVLLKFSEFLVTIGKYGLYLICVRKILTVTPDTLASEFAINYAILIGALVVLGALVFFLTMPFYFRIASHAIETANIKHVTKMKAHKSTFGTFLAKEFKMQLRDSEAMLSNFIYLLLMPFLLFIINKIFSLVDTNVLGDRVLIIVNVCLGLTMVMVSNTASATAISTEGNEFYLLKTAPSNTRQIAWAKITVNLVFSTLAIIASVICIAIVTGPTILDPTPQLTQREVLYIFLTFMIINTSHVLWSFEFDLLNPQVKEFVATGSIQNNRNAYNSMALGVALAFIVAGLIGILLFAEISAVAWTKFLIIISAFLLARIYLFVTKLKLYFNDIEM